MVGVVLSGGGARGAYQAGVLQGVVEALERNGIKPRMDIFSGVSAGAINAAWMASKADQPQEAARTLANLWSNLTSDQVFSSDAVHMGRIAMTWATELGFGALTGTTPGRALLNTAPLNELLKNNLDVSGIQRNLDAGHLRALALTAVNYNTSNSVTFVQGAAGLPSWHKSRRHSEKTEIQIEHVMASSAIPLLFPAIQVHDRWFGDGCVRNSHPCAASLYLGAEKLLVIGVRSQMLTADDQRALSSSEPPSVARVLNLLLNAVLLDGVEFDVDRLERVNEMIRRVPVEYRDNLNVREVDSLLIAPSADLGEIAASMASRLPRIVRYLLKGLGRLEDAAEIVSYLLFDPQFCSRLIELGREDAAKAEADIVRLFSDDSA